LNDLERALEVSGAPVIVWPPLSLTGPLMTAPLHTQLDRLEALLVAETSSPEKQAEAVLQNTSLALYGQPVPALWMEHLLADEPVSQTPSLIEAIDIERPAVIEQAPANRKVWTTLLKKQDYRRPQTAAVRDVMRADFLRYVTEDEKKADRATNITTATCVLSAAAVAFSAIFFTHENLIFGFVIPPVGVLVNLWANRASAKPFSIEKIKSTKVWNWTEFLNNQALDTETLSLLEKYPDLRKIALSFQHSEVGFLVGDALALKEVAKKRDALTAQAQQHADAAADKVKAHARWARLAALDASPDHTAASRSQA
jgi:hypothetical protein